MATPSKVTVTKGDTLTAIAKQAGVTLKALEAANPQITNPNLIHVGQKVVVPAKAPAKAPVKSTSTGSGVNTTTAKGIADASGPIVQKSPENGSSSSTTITQTNIDTGGIPAVPYTPASDPLIQATPAVKPASPDLIQINEATFPVEAMTDLLFENVGGTEILSLTRHDLVNGVDVQYSQISNLSKIETVYGGTNLIALQNTSEQIFSKYPLKRYQFIPETTSDPNGNNSPVYLNVSGDFVVDLINLDTSMAVETEFISATFNDIIY